jgi:hypothetical protein
LADVEFRALVDMAYPLAWLSSQRSGAVVERALALAGRQGDALQRAETQTANLVRHMGAAPLSLRNAEDCRTALADIRNAGDRLVLASLLRDRSLIECDPLDCWAAVTFTSQRGRCRFMHLLFGGEWTEALREAQAGIAMAEGNGEEDPLQTLRLCQAWVHLYAMDFGGVAAICKPLLALPKETICSATRRFCQVLAASAELGLGNNDQALQHLLGAEDEMARHTVVWDWYWRMPLESALTDAWLRKGDLTKARAHAEVLLNVTHGSGDPTWYALAWEAKAQVASADGNLPSALECIAKAAAAAEKVDIPLAAWRVHATGAELHRSAGNARLAARAQELSHATILKLANSLEGPLRQSFLAGASAGKKATSGL